jgi:hypothetical protein
MSELIIAISFLVVGLLLEIKYKIHLYHSLRERFLVTFIIFLVMMGWELINVYKFQAWLYPGSGMIGVYFFKLPLELYLFYFTAPYFCFVAYELIHKLMDNKKSQLADL